MHEFSVTSQIVKTVLQEAEKRGAKRVLEVHIVIGSLTLLGVEQVRFSYKMLVQDTIMKSSRLFIQHKKGKVKCDKCGYEGNIRFKDDPVYHVSFPTLICPECGSPVRILEGRECLVKNIKLVV